jgi:hypothetical protein
MAAVEDVKAHLTASVDDAGQALTSLAGVLDQLDEALTRLRITVVGSMHPRAVEAIGRFEEARLRITEAQTLLLGGIDATQGYRSIL